MTRILITGAAGEIGTNLRKLLPPIYPDLVLTDLKTPADLGPHETFKAADLSDLAQVEAVCEGIDGILHFGGFSVEGPWDTILQSNIIGGYNLFEAARRNGVKRIVFASSNHATGFYPRHQCISPDVTVRPDTRYGVSKVFGEAIGALYADKHGIGVTCLRIGKFADKPLNRHFLSIWLKPDDLVQLCRIGLDHPDIHFEIFYGASYNERSWWDNSRAYDLGYRPTGRAEDFREDAMAGQAKLKPDPVRDFYQGSRFCSIEFDRNDDSLRGRPGVRSAPSGLRAVLDEGTP
jgi:uronate dehydrogenase